MPPFRAAAIHDHVSRPIASRPGDVHDLSPSSRIPQQDTEQETSHASGHPLDTNLISKSNPITTTAADPTQPRSSRKRARRDGPSHACAAEGRRPAGR